MRTIIIFSIFFLLVGCSPSLTEQVDQLIEEENFDEAKSKIEEYTFSEKELKEAGYDYEEIVLFDGIKSLYENEEYKKVLRFYNENTFEEDILQPSIINMLESSFAHLLEQRDHIVTKTIRQYYDNLDTKMKSSLETTEVELVALEKELAQEVKEKEEQLKAERIQKFIDYIHQQKYQTVTMETSHQRDETEVALYNLASAYDWFFNFPEQIYAFGIDSLAERSLKEVKSDIPEINELKESLESLIYLAKSEGAKSLGVIIGMTKDEVLLSSWGKPQKVNETVTSYGTREQWVYGNRNYLYFKDDILVSIQTSR